MGVQRSQPWMPCTCRMVTPYSSPPSTKVRDCSAPDDGSLVATWFMLVRPYSCSGPADDAGQIQYQRDRSISEDRGAGHTVDVAIVRFEALDHDLLLVEEVVDEEADTAPVALHDHDEALVQVVRARLDTEDFVQADHRHVVTAEAEHLALAGHAVERALLDLQRFDDADERNDVVLLAHRDRLPIDDGKSQRQRDD